MSTSGWLRRGKAGNGAWKTRVTNYMSLTCAEQGLLKSRLYEKKKIKFTIANVKTEERKSSFFSEELNYRVCRGGVK